ncbi:hypothetical protein CEUSTIGMA_g13412.t1 [Chlamydomonas eustigma]|uniref:Uncharacterized protein n=1 Tax=Chlamydomonas eustigma TaxID=1157962 RepID=A0A250XSI5_9CHLO|nr:hypothetical protein CEUSTIGMA_g13412.t1 [Chlamydomonas eustigma]|eukprot:GAX85996.1 hypothetical protein CEUSTIGMA_g13412.t1 [Chlamydomonas eustigma]
MGQDYRNLPPEAQGVLRMGLKLNPLAAPSSSTMPALSAGGVSLANYYLRPDEEGCQSPHQSGGTELEGGGEVDGPCGSAQKKVGRPSGGRPPLPPRPGHPTLSGSQAGGRKVESLKMKAGWMEFFKTLKDANITNLSPLWAGLKELQDSLLPFFKESTSTPSQKYVIRSLASKLCSAGKLGTPYFILQQAMLSQYVSLKPHQFLTEEIPMKILYAFIFNYLYLNVAKLSQTLELAGEEENRRRELSNAMDSFYGALCEVAPNMSRYA